MAFNKNVVISLVVVLFAMYQVQSAVHTWENFAPRANVSFGVQGPNDVLFYSANAIRNATNASQVVNVPYVGFNVNITYIRALERGPNQNAFVAIVSGGIGQSNVTVRITSVAGRGFNYNIAFYGRSR